MPNTPVSHRLDGKASTLLLTELAGVPAIAWLGDRLVSSIDDAMMADIQDVAQPFATLDERAPLTLFPQLASGYMGSAALTGHRQHSAQPSNFTDATATQHENAIRYVLLDRNNDLSLQITLDIDPESDVVSITTALTNTGSDDYWVDWLASATLPLPNHYSQCISQHGRWGLENQSVIRPIGPGRIDISNQHGRTGHEHVPAIVCAASDLSIDNGDALFVHLGWSGNYSFRIEQLQDGVSYVQAGVLLSPGEECIAPNETLHCPPVYVTRGVGLNQCTQRFHQFARHCILPAWTRSPRPIHANSWEALYFNLNDKELFSLVDAASKIGAERFILDDGWFPARRDDTAGLGDWTVDATVFPNGLTPLVEHVRKQGMQFGLWFEPEMVNPDSHLYRQHPDWALHFEGVNTPLARHQLVLDVAREDVSDYLFNSIVALVHEYDIAYIKWDMNRDLVLAGNGSFPRASKQPKAVYALMQRILDACPKLEIESCSSGGARCDFGVLQKTGRVWASDNIDPLARAKIHQGFARFFPPEIMGAHVGHLRAHLTGRSTSLHTRAIVAMQGQFGFELDARKLGSEDIEILHHYTELYKQHRNWLNDANYWQLPTAHAEIMASGLVENELAQALFTVVATDSLSVAKPGHQPLRGLGASKRYRISLASTNLSEFQSFNNALPKWCKTPVTFTGELLMNIGLPLPVLPPQTGLLVHCIEESA